MPERLNPGTQRRHATIAGDHYAPPRTAMSRRRAHGLPGSISRSFANPNVPSLRTIDPLPRNDFFQLIVRGPRCRIDGMHCRLGRDAAALQCKLLLDPAD